MRPSVRLAIAIAGLLSQLPARSLAVTLFPEGRQISAEGPRAVTGHGGGATNQEEQFWRIEQASDLRPGGAGELRGDSAARSYLTARSQHYFLGNLYELLLLFGLLTVGIGTRYWNWFGRVVARPWARALLYVPAVLCSVTVLSLPLDAWNHALALGSDHSRTRWPVWIASWARSRGLDLAVVSVVFLVLYPIIRRSQRKWWLAAWGALLIVTGLAGGVSRIIAFNTVARRMEPINWRYPEVVADMERVAQNVGESIPPNHLLEMTAPGNLRPIGIGSEFAGASPMGVPERIIFAEPLIYRTNRPTVLFVFGHEMGHLALHHSIKNTVIDAIILLALAYLSFRVANWMLARWGARWGIGNIAEHASLPLLLFLLAILNFVKTPAFNLTSRYFEHEADRYGLEAIHGIVPSPAAAAVDFFHLCLESCGPDADLGGIAGFWFRDHPTNDERTRFALTYDPWSKGRHPRYIVPHVADADSGQKQTPTTSP